MTGGLIPEGMERGHCSHCGASVFWSPILDPITLLPKRSPNGTRRRVPLNRVPSSDGTWLHITMPRHGVRWIAHGEFVRADERWQTHYATCPSPPPREREPDAPRRRQPKRRKAARNV